jgi:Tfp pilus assembly protein FimV
MRVDELVGTPADQQGKAGVANLPPLSKSGADMQQQMKKMNGQNAGMDNTIGQPDPNSPEARKAAQQQKKQIQAQIKATQQQLKQLQSQLRTL